MNTIKDKFRMKDDIFDIIANGDYSTTKVTSEIVNNVYLHIMEDIIYGSLNKMSEIIRK